MSRPVPAGCGWRIWREEKWPGQWIGQCGDGLDCRGGIRCNSAEAAAAFWNDGRKHCRGIANPSASPVQSHGTVETHRRSTVAPPATAGRQERENATQEGDVEGRETAGDERRVGRPPMLVTDALDGADSHDVGRTLLESPYEQGDGRGPSSAPAVPQLRDAGVPT